MSVVCPVWVVRSLIVCNRFEFLAFSSDVSHWRQKQELVGVSVRYEDFQSQLITANSHFLQNCSSKSFRTSPLLSD